MFTHRLTTTRTIRLPRRSLGIVTLAFALGVVPLAEAGQHASPTRAHAPSGGGGQAGDDSSAGADKASAHGIIFVGGHVHGNADHAAITRAHPPGPCAPGSQSSHCSLNPQPIPPGHQTRHAQAGSATRVPRVRSTAVPHGD
jgi:hypothetical protein